MSTLALLQWAVCLVLSAHSVHVLFVVACWRMCLGWVGVRHLPACVSR